MMTKYGCDVFKYKLPAGEPSDYGEQALKVLQKLEGLNPKLLHYFLAANTVLTLSGVRAFDTYITFETLGKEEVRSAITLLAGEGITLFSNWSEYDDSAKDIYSVVNQTGLNAILEQYEVSPWTQPRPPYTQDRMIGWSYMVEFNIWAAMHDGKLPKQWQNEVWSAHNIRFGMLLGYPGEAIASACWADVLKLKDDVELPLLTSDLAYYDAYGAAHPTYYFLAELKDNPNIAGHQQLWSAILKHVYESDWHKQLKMPSGKELSP